MVGRTLRAFAFAAASAVALGVVGSILTSGVQRVSAAQVAEESSWVMNRRVLGFDDDPSLVDELAKTDQGRRTAGLYAAPLDEREEAEFIRRLDLTSRLAALQAELVRDEPQSFAYARIEQAAGGRIVIGLVDARPELEVRIREALGEGAEVIIEGARAAHVELEKAMVEQNEALRTAKHQSLVSWYIDEAQNRLVIGVASEDDRDPAEKAVGDTLGKTVPWVIEVQNSERQMSAIVGGDSLDVCSAGAQVYADTVYGRLYYTLTASHCIDPLTHCTPFCHGSALPLIAERPISIYGSSSADVQINFAGSTSSANAGLIRNYSTGTNQYVIGEGPVSSAYDVAGAVICKSGLTSGTTCGTLTDLNVTIRGNLDKVIYLQQRRVTGAGSIPGDSGGVVFSPTAYGHVVVGGVWGGYPNLIYSQISDMHSELATVGAPFVVRKWWE